MLLGCGTANNVPLFTPRLLCSTLRALSSPLVAAEAVAAAEKTKIVVKEGTSYTIVVIFSGEWVVRGRNACVGKAAPCRVVPSSLLLTSPFSPSLASPF